MQEIAKSILVALAIVLWAGVSSAHSADGRRLALVIGSSAYEAAGSLPNAVADAKQFGAFLSSQGFDTDIVTDADRKELADAVSRFARKISADDVALFYFAGHGMQLRGENYLVGTDALLASEFDVAAETLALTDVIGAIEKKSKIALVFLDACRNNPLANRLNQEVEGATRSIATRGLAPVETESAGTMVAFAAAPGQVASDGSGKNSPFTTALIGHLAGPGLEIGTAFKRVIRDVRKATDGKQSPQILSSLALEFYFNSLFAGSGASAGRHTGDRSQDDRDRSGFSQGDCGSIRRASGGSFSQRHRTRGKGGGRPANADADATRRGCRRMVSTPRATRERTRAQQVAEAARYATGASRERASARGTRTACSVRQTRRASPSTKSPPASPIPAISMKGRPKRLGCNLLKVEDGLYSSPAGRGSTMPKDFEGLETDARVWKAVDCDPWQEKVYGSFEGHMYVVMHAQDTISRKSATPAAKRCGGHLATIGSEPENDFVVSLFSKDRALSSTPAYDPDEHIPTRWVLGSGCSG